jgi:myosin heavy subunit
MKPNDNKAGNEFHSGRMQDQLRYAGLVEVCRIRKLGFPVRRGFDEFFKRFRCIDLTIISLDSLTARLTELNILIPGKLLSFFFTNIVNFINFIILI